MGQVWEHKASEVVEVLKVRKDTVLVEDRKTLDVRSMYKAYFGDMSLISDAPPSDLEIVQKALRKPSGAKTPPTCSQHWKRSMFHVIQSILKMP